MKFATSKKYNVIFLLVYIKTKKKVSKYLKGGKRTVSEGIRWQQLLVSTVAGGEQGTSRYWEVMEAAVGCSRAAGVMGGQGCLQAGVEGELSCKTAGYVNGACGYYTLESKCEGSREIKKADDVE